MKKILYPKQQEWPELCNRNTVDSMEVENTVKEIFSEVKNKGDKAISFYTNKFDKVNIKDFQISKKLIDESEKEISKELKEAMLLAKSNIEKFHTSQIQEEEEIETTEGVKCFRQSRAIERVGLYVPGGSAPLFSTVLMLAVPAKLAGCKDILLFSPPDKKGQINSAILYAAKLCGLSKLYSVGGVQSVAAMTFGTETIPSVNKIFGPGNQYVTMAKQEAQKYGLAIDMPAGPSEVLVIADKSCNPAFVAADLLSQAEHGVDSQVFLLTNDKNILYPVFKEMAKQLQLLPRKNIASACLQNSKAIILDSMDKCFKFSNLYAPEHLILAISNSKYYINDIINAGSVFLGHYSCESAGDYASGTNHTLPTNAYAKNYSGVSLDSFLKKITFQEISLTGIKNIGPAIEVMAEKEGLQAHKNAVSIRTKNLNR